MGQAAYNFEQFEQPKVHREFRAVQGGKRSSRMQALKRFRVTAASLILVGMVVTLLSCNARLTELTGEIQATQKELTTSQSTYDYLQGQLEGISTMKNVEEIAVDQLGMTKLDASQITYVTLENQNSIVCAENGFQRFFSGIQAAALSLWNSLG